MNTFRIFMACITTSGVVNALRIAESIDNPDNIPALLFSAVLMLVGALGLVATMDAGRHERGGNY